MAALQLALGCGGRLSRGSADGSGQHNFVLLCSWSRRIDCPIRPNNNDYDYDYDYAYAYAYAYDYYCCCY